MWSAADPDATRGARGPPRSVGVHLSDLFNQCCRKPQRREQLARFEVFADARHVVPCRHFYHGLPSRQTPDDVVGAGSPRAAGLHKHGDEGRAELANHETAAVPLHHLDQPVQKALQHFNFLLRIELVPTQMNKSARLSQRACRLAARPRSLLDSPIAVDLDHEGQGAKEAHVGVTAAQERIGQAEALIRPLHLFEASVYALEVFWGAGLVELLDKLQWTMSVLSKQLCSARAVF